MGELNIKSEKLFRAMIEKSADMITLALPEGKLLYASPSLTSVLGFSFEEYQSRPAFEFIHPDDLHGLMEQITGIIQTPGKSFFRQHRLLHKNGAYRWCEGTITNMLHDPDVGALVSNFRDVTSRMEAETHLKELVKELSDYRLALDKSSIIAITNQRGIIEHVNDNFCKISKYSKEELIGQDHRIINSGYHPKTFIKDLWQTIANGKIWMGELKNKAKDGTFYWMDTTIVPFLNKEGKPYQYLAIRSDITERKNSESELEEKIIYTEKRTNELSELLLKYTLMDFSQQITVSDKGDEWDAIAVGLNTLGEELQNNIRQLKENEEKYRLLYDSIDEGYCIIEIIFDEKKNPVDYRFLEINASFERQTGIRDAVGKRMREFAPDHEEHWFDIYGKIALTGESIRFENRAEQLHRWYDVYAFRFGDPKNLQVAILFNDITERKKTEAELQSVNKELEAFSYSVSHDLRAPLRAVNGYAQMLNEDYGTRIDEEGKRIIETIRYNATRMGTLIDDLLAFSRLGRKDIQKVGVDMNELTKVVLTELSKSVPHNAKIKVGQLHTVQADYSLMHQVIFNLISNAVKYSSKKENPLIEVVSEEKNGEITFSVKDNGAGFDMKYSDKLFGVFQRLHTQDEFEGTGVGLAIIQKILTKHGGKIRAEGKVNEGAVFHFTLPK